MLFSCHSNNNISNISQIASCLAVSLIYVQFLSVSYSHSRLSLFLLPCCPSVALQALPVSFHWNPSPPPSSPSSLYSPQPRSNCFPRAEVGHLGNRPPKRRPRHSVTCALYRRTEERCTARRNSDKTFLW